MAAAGVHKQRGPIFPDGDGDARWVIDDTTRRTARAAVRTNEVSRADIPAAIFKDFDADSSSYGERRGVGNQGQGGGMIRSPTEKQRNRKRGPRATNQGGRHQEDGDVIYMAGETIGLALYPRLMTILTVTEDLHPQQRTVIWIMRLIEDVYDSRRRAEAASFAAEEDHFNLDASTRRHASFPVFVYKHLKNRHGIKHVVRSACLDLVCNAHIFRRQYPQVEIFARFLEEFYGEKELCFFLDVKAEVQRVTRTFSRRKKSVTDLVWMSHADCVRVARAVFLDTATLYYRDLIDTVESQMVRPSRPTDRRKISTSDFLYLAMVCFTSPEEPSDRHGRTTAVSRSRRPQFHEAPGSRGRRAGDGSNRRSRDRSWDRSDAVGRDLADSPDTHSSPPCESIPDRCLCQRVASHANADGSRRERREVDCRMGGCEARSMRNEGVVDDGSGGGGGSRSSSFPHERKDDKECRGVIDACGGGGEGWSRSGTALRTNAIGRGDDTERDLAAAIRNESGGRSGAAVASKCGGVQVGDACEQGSRVPTASDAMPRSPSAVLHVESGFLEIVCPSTQISFPGKRTVQDRGPKDADGNTARRPTRLSTEEKSAMGRREKDVFNTRNHEDKKRGAAVRGENSSRPQRHVDELKITGDGREGTAIPHLGSVLFSATPDDCDGTSWRETREPGGQSEAGPRSAAGAGGSGDCGLPCGSRGAEVAGINRSLCVDADLTSVGEQSCSTYVSAEEGGGGSRVGERVRTGPTSDPRLNALLANGPSPLPAAPSVLPPQSFPPAVPKPPRRPSTIAADMTTHRTSAEQSPRRESTSSLSSRGRSPDGWRGEQSGFGFFGGAAMANIAPRSSRRRGIATAATAPAASADSRLSGRGSLDHRKRQASTTARGGVSSSSNMNGSVVRDDSSEDDQSLDIRTDVLALATEWFSEFEQRFLPLLTAKCGAEAAAAATESRGEEKTRARQRLTPRPISRILSEEMVRILALRRQDLHAVARNSPDLLHNAVSEAFWTVDRAVSNSTSHCLALCDMGRLLETRGHPDEALLCFEEASFVHSSSAEPLFLRAANMQKKGDLQNAAFFFEAAVGRDESHWPAWHGLGQTCASLRKFRESVEAFSRWLRWSSVDAGEFRAATLVQLGDAQKELGEVAQAQESYESAALMDIAVSSDAYFKLGTLLQARRGHEAEALEAFRLVVKAAEARSTPSGHMRASHPSVRPSQHQDK